MFTDNECYLLKKVEKAIENAEKAVISTKHEKDSFPAAEAIEEAKQCLQKAWLYQLNHSR
ncbi:hypothetical protein [Alteribacillus sp. HJP-4]|uniref:hypothetical protein n=1 Tax=Alteribacillus sp. HJP-4 TaxID=2775394 RepID=UPI0035CD0524